MDIYIHPESVEIRLERDNTYSMTWIELDHVEEGIKLIREIQKIAVIESANITTL